jgi:signal recognition particle receptor subunit beta
MVVLNYTGEEINAKIVYYGPGLSGKTTNLEYLYGQMPADSKGQMVSMKTRTDRTLFFDFFPLELGEISGYRTRFLLYTVPGQVYYNATRKLVLKGADAVVFVADSAPDKLQENIESLRNLEDNLNEHGLSLDNIPWVIQYNKRDLPDCMPVAELHQHLNLMNVPAYEAIAMNGSGVYDTFKEVAGLLYRQLKERLESGEVIASQSMDGDDVMPRMPGEAPEDVNVAIDSALRELGGAKPTAPGPMPTQQPTVPSPATPLATPIQPAQPAQPPSQQHASSGDASQPHAQDDPSAWDVSQPPSQQHASSGDASQPVAPPLPTPHVVPSPPVAPVPTAPPEGSPIPAPVQPPSKPAPPPTGQRRPPIPQQSTPASSAPDPGGSRDASQPPSQNHVSSGDASQPPSQHHASSGDASQPPSQHHASSGDASQPDNGFNFVPKDEKSSPEIGRLVEFDETTDTPDSGEDPDEFITDPMRPSASEEPPELEAQEAPVVTKPKPEASEQEVVVPVVVSRSQVRKTIPLKVRLEIRVVDD